MLSLALLVASIAIADSVNPSTVVPALWLAGSPSGRGLASFTFGVFAGYLAGGLALGDPVRMQLAGVLRKHAGKVWRVRARAALRPVPAEKPAGCWVPAGASPSRT